MVRGARTRGPSHGPPKSVRAAMVAAGARCDECRGENLRHLDLGLVGSPAWQVYANWARHVDGGQPIVSGACRPWKEPGQQETEPPGALAFAIHVETNSVIQQLALLFDSEVSADGLPELPGELADPELMVQCRDARVAVITTPQVLANPGANYPVIDSIRSGVYVCSLVYTWRNGTLLTARLHKDWCNGRGLQRFPRH